MRYVLFGLVCIMFSVVWGGCSRQPAPVGSNSPEVLSELIIYACFEEQAADYFIGDDGDEWLDLSLYSDSHKMVMFDISDVPTLLESTSGPKSRLGVDEREHDRVRLVREGDRLYVETDSRFVSDDYAVDIDTRAEVEFEAGGWEDYETIGDVTVKYTETGLASYKSQIESQLALAIRHFMKDIIIEEVWNQVNDKVLHISLDDLEKGDIVFLDKDVALDEVEGLLHIHADVRIESLSEPVWTFGTISGKAQSGSMKASGEEEILVRVRVKPASSKDSG